MGNYNQNSTNVESEGVPPKTGTSANPRRIARVEGTVLSIYEYVDPCTLQMNPQEQLVAVTTSRFTVFRNGQEPESWTIRVFEGSGPEQEVYRYTVDHVAVKS